MKHLELKQNDYGLRVFCPKCNNKWNYDKLHKCKHFSQQKYKQYIYHNGKTRVRTYETRDYDMALIEAIDFKRKVKNGINDYSNSSIPPNNDDLSVIDSAEKYIQYKNGIGVYEFEKKEYDKDYLSSITLYIQQFVDVMRKHKYHLETMPVSSINREHVDLWWRYVKKRYESPWSQHATLRAMRAWINHAINYQEIAMRNPFKDVKVPTPNAKIVTITKKEFDSLCSAVNTASPYALVGVKKIFKKNRYRDYLIDAFKLALYTGLRREELVSLKWSDIYQEEHTQGYLITTENLKVERITGQSYKPKFIPIYGQLEELLINLGWRENENSNKHILVPKRNIRAQTIMDALTKAFSHYYSKAYPDSPVKQFKSLRKTYLSYLEKYVGKEAIHLSSHGDNAVLEKHYVNPKIVAKGYDMKIFS